MIRWVPWKGEVAKGPEEPRRRGCSSRMDRKDAPAELDPAEEEWLQMVPSLSLSLAYGRSARLVGLAV